MTIFMKREEYMIIVMQTYHCIKKREVLEYNTPKEMKKKRTGDNALELLIALKNHNNTFWKIQDHFYRALELTRILLSSSSIYYFKFKTEKNNIFEKYIY